MVVIVTLWSIYFMVVIVFRKLVHGSLAATLGPMVSTSLYMYRSTSRDMHWEAAKKFCANAIKRGGGVTARPLLKKKLFGG